MPTPFRVRDQDFPGVDLGGWNEDGSIDLPGDIKLGGNIYVDGINIFDRLGTLNLTDYYRNTDGNNWRPALGRALSAATASGASIYCPPGVYNFLLTGSALNVPGNVTIWGFENLTTFNLDTSTAGAYGEFLRNSGNNITVEGINFTRTSDYLLVMFPIQSYTGIRFSRCRLVGNRDVYTGNSAHGWQLGVQNAGVMDQLTIEKCNVSKMAFGLFQTNASTATWTNVKVVDCTFDTNYASDLEFNAPLGTATGVRVTRCIFRNNQISTSAAGFAVGLAHIFDAVVRDNQVTNYNNEAFHVEDYSQDVKIVDNVLTSCGLLFGSYVQVISGAQRVKIDGNSILASANTNTIACINVLAGGTGTTPGGRPVIAPRHVITVDNDLDCGANTRGIYYETVLRGIIHHNILKGTGVVTAGSYGGGTNWAIQVYDGSAQVISDNIIRGFLYGFFPRTDSITAFGDGYTVTGNTIRDCFLGMGLTNAGNGTISDNNIGNCTWPAIHSYTGSAAHNAIIEGNNAIGNAQPMQIYGTVSLTTTGSATIGAGKTLAIAASPNLMPSGTVITFSGGGTLTLTTQANFQTTSLSGTVAGANIGVGETATVYLSASSTVTFGRLVSMNQDDALGSPANVLGSLGIRKTVAANTVLTGAEAFVVCTAAVTVTLPHAARYYGAPIIVKDASVGVVTVASGGGTIDGGATATLAAGAVGRYVSDGTNWVSV